MNIQNVLYTGSNAPPVNALVNNKTLPQIIRILHFCLINSLLNYAADSRGVYSI